MPARSAKSSRAGARRARLSAAAAFTLLEVVLAVSLLVVILGLSLAAYISSLDNIRQDQSTDRIMSLLRSARADAALTGRRIRVAFDAASPQPAVTIEADPLEQPNTFAPYQAWWVGSSKLEDRIVFRSAVSSGGVEGSSGSSETGQDQSAFAPLTFNPDGASDSGTIVLEQPGAAAFWAVAITLNGADGTISARRMEQDELAP